MGAVHLQGVSGALLKVGLTFSRAFPAHPGTLRSLSYISDHVCRARLFALVANTLLLLCRI